MENSIGQETAIVTGASRGIGRAVALQLARDGYNIAFCYRNKSDSAREVSGEIERMGRQTFFQMCDVGNFASVKEFLSSVEERFGIYDVVVNNAGITEDNPLVLMEEESWSRVIHTNLDGIFNVCRCAIFSFMKRKSGCIINISSVSGIYGKAKQTNYSAAKAGIIGFSKALAKEVGPYGIRVNVVAPGLIDTDMTEKLSQKAIDEMINDISLRRIGKAEEVAQLVSFLVSDKAQYITGQIVQVDGGIIV